VQHASDALLEEDLGHTLGIAGGELDEQISRSSFATVAPS
jgi:hypothetical protein